MFNRLRIARWSGFFLFFLAVSTVAPAAWAAGTITGTVFVDYDADGVRDAGEPGQAGITVSAYDAAQTLRGTAVSGATGAYTLTATGTGPYRLEFTGLATGVYDGHFGADSGTTIQFVPNGNSSANDLGLSNPTDYCPGSPMLVTASHENGSGVGQNSLTTNFALFRFPYDSPTRTNLATTSQIGATWGIAHRRTTDQVFASSFLRRHMGLGPRGMDGVYVLDAATDTLLGGFDLEGLTATNGGTLAFGSVTRSNVAGTVAASAAGDTQLSSAPANPNVDLDAFGKVGTVGYGDIDLAPNDRTLWMVNLNQRTLIALDLPQVDVTGVVPVPSSAIRHYNIVSGGPSGTTITGAPGCTNGTLRPFGLKITGAKGFLGVVCDASTSGTRVQPSDQVGYVLSFNPSTPTAFTTEVTIPMGYTRERVYQAANGASASNLPAASWQRWTSSWSDVNTATVSGQTFTSMPQPILSDIEIADDGALLLGFMDRASYQEGWQNYPPIAFGSPDARDLVGMVAAGDILRVPASGAGFGTPESGDADPGVPPTGAGGVTTFLSNDSAGNGGEFFWGDYVPRTGGSTDTHFEITLGALAVLRGRHEVVSTVYDAEGFFTMGAAWLDTAASTNTVERWTAYATSFTNASRFGKSAGLGDLEVLCDPAPIEIGNRVWLDSIADGLQNPGEAVLSGVTVQLWQNGVQVGTTTTSATGEYYFNASNVAGGVLPNTAYQVRLLAAQPALSGLSPTLPNQGTNDAIDSDGTTVGAYVQASLTTGDPGANDHTWDFGFVTPTTTTSTSSSTTSSSSSTSITTSTSTSSSSSSTSTSSSITTSTSSSTSSTSTSSSTSSTSTSSSTSSTSTSSSTSSTSTSSSSTTSTSTPSSTTSTSTSSTSTSSSSTSTSSSSTSTSSSTTTSSTSTTTSSSTSSSSSSTSTSTTTSSTSTTAAPPPPSPRCGCQSGAFTYRAERQIKFNNDSSVTGSAMVNQPHALLRTGKNVVVSDGSLFFGDRMILGNSTSAWSVQTNLLRTGQSVIVRDGSGLNPPPTGALPAVTPLCGSFAPFTCGGPDVRPLPNQLPTPVAPGTYGHLQILDGMKLVLEPGTFQFCDVKIGRDAQLLTRGDTTINVVGGVTVGTGSYAGPETAADFTPFVNILGTKVRVSQGATLQAAIDAPNAKLTFGRDSTLLGCFCGLQAKSDKHITLVCTD